MAINISKTHSLPSESCLVVDGSSSER